MPAAAATVSAAFTPISYTITTSGITNGTVTAKVTGATVPTATVGANVTLTIEAVAGYKYTENSLTVTQTGGATVELGGSGTVRTFTMPAGHVTVAATFEALPPTEHSVNVPAGITADKTSAAVGTMVTLTIAHPGYEYTADSLKVNGGAVPTSGSGNGPYTFTMPDANVTVTAKFTTEDYDITITPPSNGTVTASVNGTSATAASVNDTVTLTLSENTNYRLQSLTVSAGSDTVAVTGTTNIRTFTMPASPVTVTAVFQYLQSATSYPVYVTTSPNGAIQINNGQDNADQTPATEGTFVTITLKPVANYQLKAGSLTVNYGSGQNEEVQGSGNIWTFTMPNHPVTVSAEFELIPTAGPHAITVPAPDGGTITPDKNQAQEGDTVTVTLVPGDDRTMPSTITVSKEGGGTVTPEGSGNTWTFTMPGVPVTVSAVFDKEYHNIIISPMSGGTVTSTNKTQQQGLVVGLTITADAGFELEVLSVKRSDNDNPLVVSATGKANYKTFTMPAANVTVSATFTGEEVTAPGLYKGNDSEPQVLSGEGTMLAQAFAKIKEIATNKDIFTIMLDTSEVDASAAGYIIGAVDGSSIGSKTSLGITLIGINENVTISKTGLGPLFTMQAKNAADSVILTLQNIELKGHAGNNSPLVKVTGAATGSAKATLIMNDGSAISGNSGGGVSLTNKNGVFTMNGGTIKGNSAANGAAAVRGVTGATFTKTGGTIYGKESTGGNANTPENGGHVIEIGTKWRDTEAGEDNNTADEGFWEN
jgi:hypothetical protein